jgi:hypothetical protein
MSTPTSPTPPAPFNVNTFPTPADAAESLVAPFIGLNPAPGTTDVYSYAVADMDQTFNVSEPVWQFGGPELGLSGSTYTAQTDCSGFTARVLNATVLPGESQSVYAKLVTQPDGTIHNFQTDGHPQPFPSADDYANWIATGGQQSLRTIAFSSMSATGEFTKQGSFAEAQPGDILAYSLPTGSKDTGHVMIIQHVQQLTQGEQNLPYWGSNLTEFTGPAGALSFFAVSVFDSSNVPHFADQRRIPSTSYSFPTGVGVGTVLIIADGSGAPIGFMFKEGDKLLEIENIATSLPDTGNIGTLSVGRVV